MERYIVKILDTEFITHDVKRFQLEKPPGYTFIPGQGANISINHPDWKHKLRPFTFTGLNKWDHLELIIKIYPQYKSVTDQLGRIQAGAELILHEPFGAIQYKGTGVFLAGGSGITPFLAIFRDLYSKKQLKGNKLIYSNKSSYDVILGNELFKMLKQNFINVYTRESVIGFMDRRIDRNFLIENIVDFSQQFYVCGPEEFVNDISKTLLELGVAADGLVIEK